MGGNFHLKLNIDLRPIANKYREGKMKRTLERELKVPEIARREANGTSFSLLEIVADQGEFLFRKGSIAEPAVCDVSFVEVSSGTGCSEIIAFVSGLASVLLVHWLRSLPRYFCAFSFHCGIIWVKVGWSTRTAVFRSFMSRNIAVPVRWRNGFILPVLKHGPRSRPLSQVCEWQTYTRNESNGYEFLRCIGRLRSIERGLSYSDKGRTRKMVNYV